MTATQGVGVRLSSSELCIEATAWMVHAPNSTEGISALVAIELEQTRNQTVWVYVAHWKPSSVVTAGRKMKVHVIIDAVDGSLYILRINLHDGQEIEHFISPAN